MLILLGCYWPGNDASGPNQSLRGLAAALCDSFDFAVVAASGPPGKAPSADPRAGWQDRDSHRVHYLHDGRFGAAGLRRLMQATPHDILCLNSVFDRAYTLPALAFRRLGLVPRRPTLLSPRGEFDAGALGLKPRRKRAMIAAARMAGLWRGVIFHATGPEEEAALRRRLGSDAPIAVAPNIRLPLAASFEQARDGRMRIAFVGRISPKKQLDYALAVLARVRAPVVFDVYGPEEDAAHAARCRTIAARLPPHVAVRWHGAIDGAQVAAALGRADLLFLPTLGENFGHAIYEALACGVPALLSDQTPWRDLATDGAGWDLPLDRPEGFAAAIDTLAGEDSARRAARRASAAARARRWTETSDPVGANRRLFQALVDRPEASP